jgi:hypothetical protein
LTDRPFLDANVLFSAAWREDARVRRRWELGDVLLLTSSCAEEEARRNLPEGPPRDRLDRLLRDVTRAPEVLRRSPPREVLLAEKDIPILLAALAAGASHLLTGDRRHFGPLLGHRVEGVLVQTPGEYLGGR